MHVILAWHASALQQATLPGSAGLAVKRMHVALAGQKKEAPGRPLMYPQRKSVV